MAEYKHGEMEMTEHYETFDGFIRASTRVVGVVVVLIILMAIFWT
ncbi:aa3-type cytochrome c oxidase subunit IV [Chachezhania sediminis]|nr:aa3-type cytochrome c oxidase subunit IV [Chachezhania sediminis]